MSARARGDPGPRPRGDRRRRGPGRAEWSRHPAYAADDRTVELFAERVEDYKATVRRCAADEVGVTVAALLAEHLEAGARVVVPPGLGLDVPGAVVDDQLSAAELDDLDGVVTAARVGIAETGTIVLDHAEDQGRRAITLVPDLHVCVVRADQVVPRRPRRRRGPRPHPPPDLDQRPVGHQRHRARPRRGRPRSRAPWSSSSPPPDRRERNLYGPKAQPLRAESAASAGPQRTFGDPQV